MPVLAIVGTLLMSVLTATGASAHRTANYSHDDSAGPDVRRPDGRAARDRHPSVRYSPGNGNGIVCDYLADAESEAILIVVARAHARQTHRIDLDDDRILAALEAQTDTAAEATKE